MKIWYADLHSAAFLGGKNFGLKLDTTKVQGLELEFDEEKKRLVVKYNGHVGYIPETNLAIYCPPIEAKLKAVSDAPASFPVPQAGKHPGKMKAQASTPTSHVFKDDPHAER